MGFQSYNNHNSYYYNEHSWDSKTTKKDATKGDPSAPGNKWKSSPKFEKQRGGNYAGAKPSYIAGQASGHYAALTAHPALHAEGNSPNAGHAAHSAKWDTLGANSAQTRVAQHPHSGGVVSRDHHILPATSAYPASDVASRLSNESSSRDADSPGPSPVLGTSRGGRLPSEELFAGVTGESSAQSGSATPKQSAPTAKQSAPTAQYQPVPRGLGPIEEARWLMDNGQVENVAGWKQKVFKHEDELKAFQETELLSIEIEVAELQQELAEAKEALASRPDPTESENEEFEEMLREISEERSLRLAELKREVMSSVALYTICGVISFGCPLACSLFYSYLSSGEQ
jgi:hypothetical protein